MTSEMPESLYLVSYILPLIQYSLALQKQAIQNARSAFSRLTRKHAVFKQCIFENDSVIEVVKAIEEKYWSHRSSRSTRILQGFRRYTIWLETISDVVDTVVQIQAGIACPLWAPIKFVLKVWL